MKERKVGQLIGRTDMVTLPGDASVRTASRLMSKQAIGAVLVLDGDSIEGIFTERDAVTRVLAEGLDPDATKLAQVMTTNVVTLTPEACALDALRLMHEAGIRHIPVMENADLIGMISLRDFIGVELQQAEITWDAS